MVTTQDLLVKKSQRLSLCKHCLSTLNFKTVGYKSRVMDDDYEDDDYVEDIGIECPNCETWHHSFYTDKWLRDNRPVTGAPRHIRREYAKRFKKVQKRLKKVYG